MTFEGRELPSGDWTAFLRREAKRPFDEMHDARPLQWVTRLVTAHPELSGVLCEAWRQLLGDDDDDVRGPAIELLNRLPCDLGGALVDAIVEDHDRMARARATSDAAKSLLGVAVFQLHMLGPSVKPSPTAAQVLATVDRAEDGWPWSLVIALRGDPGFTLPRLVPALQRMDPSQLRAVAEGMVVNGPPSTERGFDEVARAPAAVRDAFAAAVRDLEESDMMVDLLGEPKPASRWPEFARRLGAKP